VHDESLLQGAGQGVDVVLVGDWRQPVSRPKELEVIHDAVLERVGQRATVTEPREKSEPALKFDVLLTADDLLVELV